MPLGPRLAERVGERRGLAVGLVLTITVVAFENLGVATAMPVVARELGGLSLYGWAFTAPLLASIVGITVAGRQVDRLGPGLPFAAGLVLFATGLTIAGTARTMPILVAGRFVQGLGTGAVPPVAYAAIGRAFADRARARMFALMSTAWVLPGVVGPAIAGTVAEEIGWRWVFLAIVPLVFATGCLALPTLLAIGRPAVVATSGIRGPIGRAAALAAGVGLVVAGLSWLSPLAIPVVIAGIAIATRPLQKLLPRGTLKLARGLPAAAAARGLQTFAFFGAEAYIPLALNDLRNQRAAVAGLVLTGSTITWTTGAWVQERSGHAAGRRRLVGRGFVVLTAGVVLGSMVLLDAVPVAAAAAGWALAGLGMGMSYSGLSLIVLAEAPPGREGEATSALQLSDVLGMALGTGLGGAAVALGNAAGWSPRPGVAVAFALAATAGVLACAASRRLPMGRETDHEDPLAIHGAVGDPGIGADRSPSG
ncbi:MAG: hypothetical protein QOF60_3370 [Actinomycetota bacterium]|jgi:MFS family permease|nr:hypothetical protein [Actinomycetota bacterium]